MPNYNDFMMRHGEHGVQALIEQIERNEGIKGRQHVALEQRWASLAQSSAPTKMAA